MIKRIFVSILFMGIIQAGSEDTIRMRLIKDSLNKKELDFFNLIKLAPSPVKDHNKLQFIMLRALQTVGLSQQEMQGGLLEIEITNCTLPREHYQGELREGLIINDNDICCDPIFMKKSNESSSKFVFTLKKVEFPDSSCLEGDDLYNRIELTEKQAE